MKLLSIVGARPNFMKIAPLSAAVRAHNARHPAQMVKHVLVHSGQHYDPGLSSRFFEELGIPSPDHHLGVGSGTHAYQVGTTMIEFEKVLLAEKPDWVIVVGDVNATCACSLTAKKHQFKVAHIEAGLRSNDWSMPEEINRVVTDRLSDLLFTTCQFANRNLAAEGVAPEKIALVGNIMIDTLEQQRVLASNRRPEAIAIANRLDADDTLYAPDFRNGYAVLTLHRPSNVDQRETLHRNVDMILNLAKRIPFLFPVHPRTLGRLKEFGCWEKLASSPNMHLLHPLGYLDMLALTLSASVVLTDSGGIQEECCVAGTPCLTLRENTERPATLVENGGTNHLVGTERDAVIRGFEQALIEPRSERRPALWDGKTAERILARLLA